MLPRRAAFLLLLLTAACAQPDDSGGVSVVEYTPSDIAIVVEWRGGPDDAKTRAAIERAARETLNRGYSHFRFDYGRQTALGLSRRMYLRIELLRGNDLSGSTTFGNKTVAEARRVQADPNSLRLVWR